MKLLSDVEQRKGDNPCRKAFHGETGRILLPLIVKNILFM
ncbi:hypothetical protein ATN83_2378 [Raoultella ornithinolytica]|nr:hypothetical protein ATN83_2378 [Raoultella ornithinolytica]KDV94524.1 hypothetical protein AB00_2668 [Raoultella ornithinolytica 2-156-04_S1_C1]KDX14748.1 hypothetical protein AB28_2851 [Raoultella ornithinolytica 2-156-04_S1_C2]